jgi:ADP-ribose pyrophosphatase YjhB (NUDIX family)
LTFNPRVQAGVGVVVLDGTGRILLERRSDNGSWSLPGGKMEPGETFEETAIREIGEETGLTIRVTALIGIYSDPREGRIVTYPDNGDMRHIVDVVFLAEIVSGELRLSEESLDLQFFEPGCLPDEIVPPAQKPIRDFVEGKSMVVS